MNTKCIKKISVNICYSNIKFKLSISALLLVIDNNARIEISDFENKRNSEIRLDHNLTNFNNEKYIFRVIMTSFEPIELTTKLGGPWEGYYLWNTIQDKISSRNKKLSIFEFIEMIDISFNKLEDSEVSISTFDINSGNNSIKLMDYHEYLKQSHLNADIVEDSEKTKDYFLNIKLENMDSDVLFHLRSSIRDNILPLNDINIIKCLSEMLDLIKMENNYLHDNLKNFLQFNRKDEICRDNNKLCNNSNELYGSDISLKNDQTPIKTEKICNISASSSNNSPNTRGTLNLSELRVNSETNIHQKNLNVDFSSITKEKKFIDNKLFGNANINRYDEFEPIKSRIKTYRFIKDLSNNYSVNHDDNYMFNNKSFISHKNSNLKSTIETIRKAQSELFSSFSDESEYESIKMSKYKPPSKELTFKYKKNDFQSNKSLNRQFLNKEQLMNKLSKTKDIGERIDILKSIIRTTKKESISF